MKNTLFLALAALFFSAANAQVTDSTVVGDTSRNVVGDTTKKKNMYGSYSTRDSIAAKYKLLPMPEGTTIEKTFPVLGSYQLTSTQDSAASAWVNVSLDSANRGVVWVDGLPQGRFKAFLKKSPSTYRIVQQKSESGKEIPEGTLVLDTATQTLNIALGAPYNELDPAGVFAMKTGTTPEDNTAEVKVKTKNTKVKTKIEFYTATKQQAATTAPATTTPTTENNQQQNNQQ